jgi:hypothetical protein
MPQLSNLKYSCSYRNTPIYWGFSAHPSMKKSGRRIWVAEGEELGSNLLRVTQSSLGDPGGLGRFFGKGPPPEVACSSLKGARPIPRSRWLYRP